MATNVESKTMTGAEALLEALQREGVEFIFGYPGGANLPIYQALPKFPGIKHVLVRHEQGAAHMADGYARACGKPGVALATSGPGALNMVTGLATAFMDSVPMIAITGQVDSVMVGRDAFQEADIIGCTQSVTKHSYLVTRAQDIPRVVKEAFYIATTGRPGPVLIDICKDAQKGPWEPTWPGEVDLPGYQPPSALDEGQVELAAEALMKAERPVILVGHGVILSGAQAEVQELAEKTGTPVGTTLLGVGAFPVDHPLALHMTGFMGTGWNLKAVQHADLLLMIGMRVDDRVTAKLDEWAPMAETFIHIDIDPSEMGKNVRPHLEVVGDAKAALAQMLRHVQGPPAGRSEWLTQIDRWREDHPLRYARSNGHLQPQDVMLELYRRADNDAIVVADVGLNQIWAALWWNYAKPGLFINSGGAGTMGFALPAAIGAKIARPDKAVWVVAGEGGFVMTVQELSVAVKHRLDVKIVILNNHTLGMVRQFQDDFYGGIRSEVDLTEMPDFVKLAEAYGLTGLRITSAEEIGAAFDRAQSTPGPVLIECLIDPAANVYPIVPLGKGLNDFWEMPDEYV